MKELEAMIIQVWDNGADSKGSTYPPKGIPFAESFELSVKQYLHLHHARRKPVVGVQLLDFADTGGSGPSITMDALLQQTDHAVAHIQESVVAGKVLERDCVFSVC
jgi:hypothetical protein